MNINNPVSSVPSSIGIGTPISGGNAGAILVEDASNNLAEVQAEASGAVLVSGGDDTPPAYSRTPTLDGITLVNGIDFEGEQVEHLITVGDSTTAGLDADAIALLGGQGGPANGSVPGGIGTQIFDQGGKGGTASATHRGGKGGSWEADGGLGGDGSATQLSGDGGDFISTAWNAGSDGGGGRGNGGNWSGDAGQGASNGTCALGTVDAAQVDIGIAGRATSIKGRLEAQQGTGAGRGHIGCQIAQSYGLVSSGAGATKSDLKVLAIPANTLGTNGDSAVFEVWGSFTGGGGFASTLRIEVGGTVIFDSGSRLFANGDWRITGRLSRVLNTAQLNTAGFQGDPLVTAVAQNISSFETLSNALNFKCTCQNASGLAGAGLITQSGAVLRWEPAI